jgi:hypothetical protein
MNKGHKTEIMLIAGMIFTILVSHLPMLYTVFYHALTGQPKAEAGMLRLPEVKAGERIILDGEWEFYWQRLLITDQEASAAPDLYLPVPHCGARYQLQGEYLPTYGFASFRLKLKGYSGPQPVTVYLPDFGSAYRIYIDGSLTSESGTISKNQNDIFTTTVAELYPITLSADKEHDIVIEVATTRFAGLYMAPMIQSYDEVIMKASERNNLRMILFGTVLFSFFIFLILYVFTYRKTGRSTWLPIIGFFVLVRIMLTTEFYHHWQSKLFFNLSYEDMNTLMFFVTFAFKYLLIFLVQELLGIVCSRKEKLSFLIYYIVLYLLYLFIPSGFYNRHLSILLPACSFAIEFYLSFKVYLHRKQMKRYGLLIYWGTALAITGLIIDCYYKGELITLTAIPDSGYRFKEWRVVSGEVTITDNQFIMPDSAVAIKAIFEEIPGGGEIPEEPTIKYSIMVGSAGNGTASSDASSASKGELITLTAVPDSGYFFKEWKLVSGEVTITDNTFIMPDSAVVIKAIFEENSSGETPEEPEEPATKYSVIVESEGNGMASANVSSASKGELITLTAIPDSGYFFKEWKVVSGNVTITDNQFIMPDSAVVIRAIFEEIPEEPTIKYSITVENEGNGTASSDISSASKGELITLTVIPDSGYRFKEWKLVSGEVTITDNQFIMPDSAVVIKAIFEEISSGETPEEPEEPATKYSIIVESEGNGTASAGASSASKGELITLTATPGRGYRFKEWKVVSGDVTITDDTFIMPEGDVVIRAIFEEISGGETPEEPEEPAIKYSITVESAGIGTATSNISSALKGDMITLTATPGSGYRFKEWKIVSGEVTITSNTFIMPDSAVVIKAIFEENPREITGTDNNEIAQEATEENKDEDPTTKEQVVVGKVTVKATKDTNNTAKVEITEQGVTTAIDKAQSEARDKEKSGNDIAASVEVSIPAGCSSLEVALTEQALKNLLEAGVSSLEISSSIIDVKFDTKALKEIMQQSNGAVTVSVTPVSNLSDDAKKIIGSRTVYDISISYQMDGQTRTITSLGEGNINIYIPYTPGEDEAVGCLFGVYVDSNGNVIRMEKSIYDENSGCVIISSDHLSIYGVGYIKASTKYSDIKSHWAKEAIDYGLSRGLITGT